MADRAAAKAMDWTAARERLQAAMRRLQALAEIDPVAARRILDQRAQVLARPLQDAEPLDDAVTVVVFAVGAESYAIEARYVREVARTGEMVTLPGAPPFLVGAARVRGEIHAVFDIAQLVGPAVASSTSRARLIALGAERVQFALAADTVDQVTSISLADIRAPDETTTSKARLYVRGLTKNALIVLDGAALLADRSLYIGGFESELDVTYGEERHEA
jgi:purine-binding chemotaxis protein CheW